MEGMEVTVEKEQEFDFKQFLTLFSSPKVVQVYGLLIAQYANNDVHTNHCVIKMLHRIAVQVGDPIHRGGMTSYCKNRMSIRFTVYPKTFLF